MHRLPPSAWLPQFFAHIARLPGTQFMYDFLVFKSYFHRFLWTATFCKFIMKPQVTHWILPVYVFHRNELTNRGAEIFLTFYSRPITKEIIVSHHTRTIISCSLYIFDPIFHCSLQSRVGYNGSCTVVIYSPKSCLAFDADWFGVVVENRFRILLTPDLK